MRMLPFFKPKKGFQLAGSGLDADGGGGGGGGTSAFANKTDLTAIILTGTTNTSGGVISAGTWFYLNGKPCIAKVDIASGATFTLNTNYEEKTVGSALTELNSNIEATLTDSTSGINISLHVRGKVVIALFSNIPCETTGDKNIDLSTTLSGYLPAYDVQCVGLKTGAQSYDNMEWYVLQPSGNFTYYVYGAGSKGVVTLVYSI